MSERTQDITLAKALGYTVYHYDKDVRENCYYCLMDPDFSAVVMYPFRAGERKTEAEAWNDAPRFGESLDALALVENEIERRGLHELYTYELAALCGYPQSHTTNPMVWTWRALWAVAHATSEQRCQAALKVLNDHPDATA